jgi:alkylhydroperoxidase/carboxymuconolactone decarboxylase family protein YurZ
VRVNRVDSQAGYLPAPPHKLVAFVDAILHVGALCTNLNADGTRRHIRAALDAGATHEEILMVFKMASVMSIHSCTLGVSILLEEATMGLLDEASEERKNRLKNPEATPAPDKMRAAGQWNQAWDPFFELAPAWSEEVMAAEIMIYTSGVLPPKLIELLSIALDTSYTPTCMRPARAVTSKPHCGMERRLRKSSSC